MLKREPPTWKNLRRCQKIQNAHPNVFIIEGVSINTIFMVCYSGHECHGCWEEQRQDQSIALLNNVNMIEGVLSLLQSLVSSPMGDFGMGATPSTTLLTPIHYPLSRASSKFVNRGWRIWRKLKCAIAFISLQACYTKDKLTIQYQELDTKILIMKGGIARL